MKIIAASIAEAADSFLHAGYISAYPRPLDEWSYPETAPVEQLDVAEALRLKGEALANAGLLSDSGTPLVAAGELTTVVLVGMAALGLLALFYLHRHRFSWTWRQAGPVMAMLMLALLVRCGAEEPLPTEPPWKEVALEQYEDPEAATKVLLHGVIAEAIGSMHREISILPNIQYEAKLPAAQLTQGQAYALQTYGIDGWGHEMRLERDKGDHTDIYTVTSAGADGSFDTPDDLRVKVNRCSNSSWDNRTRSFFLRADSAGSLMVLFHRWTGSHFEYRNLDKAQQVTGGETFDLFQEGDLQPSKIASAKQAYQQLADGKPYSPMVLQVFAVD